MVCLYNYIVVFENGRPKNHPLPKIHKSGIETFASGVPHFVAPRIYPAKFAARIIKIFPTLKSASEHMKVKAPWLMLFSVTSLWPFAQLP